MRCEREYVLVISVEEEIVVTVFFFRFFEIDI